MAKLPLALRSLHTQLKQSWTSLLAQNHLALSHPKEIELLLSHQYAELVEEIRVDNHARRHNLACIHGVRNRRQQGRRYAWVYVTLGVHFWKCESLMAAYQLVDDLKQYRRLRNEVDQWEDRLLAQKEIAQHGREVLN